MNLQIKRIYDAASPTDGKRILVDRLWPRGVSKEKAQLDLWLKDAAPSPQLRTWFGHKSGNFPEFSQQYRHELATDPQKAAALDQIIELAQKEPVTLLYAARDPRINHAIVLLEFLQNIDKTAAR